jgi:hypothetical protein
MNMEKYKKDIDELVKQGNALYFSMFKEDSQKSLEDLKEQLKKRGTDDKGAEKIIKDLPTFKLEYQAWYSEALSCLSQLMPERVTDFTEYYRPQKDRKQVTYENYRIADYLDSLQVRRGNQIVVNTNAAISKMRQQQSIVEGLKRKFESSLFDIKKMVQADLLDSELESAGELLKHGYARAAGALVGVALEAHLAQIAADHKLKIKNNPSINDYNDILKNASVIDIPTWRRIQFLADLRNLCDHKKQSEPTKEQIEDLIMGTQKIIKTIF